MELVFPVFDECPQFFCYLSYCLFSVIRVLVYDQYASLVALLIFFLSDLNFSLWLSVGFCFILLNRLFLALISSFTSDVIQGGLSRVDDVWCGTNWSIAVTRLDLKVSHKELTSLVSSISLISANVFSHLILELVPVGLPIDWNFTFNLCTLFEEQYPLLHILCHDQRYQGWLPRSLGV